MGESKLITSVGIKVVTRETLEVATGFLVDNWGSHTVMDVLGLATVIVTTDAVLLGSTVALLETVALLLGVLVIEAVLGGLAGLLLLAVGLFVAVRLFAGKLIFLFVGLVMSVVRQLAVFAGATALVNVAMVALGVIMPAVVAMRVSSDAGQAFVALLGAVMSRSIRVIRAVALLLAVIVTSVKGLLVTKGFFAAITLLFQVFISSSISPITSVTFILTVALFLTIASYSAKRVVDETSSEICITF